MNIMTSSDYDILELLTGIQTIIFVPPKLEIPPPYTEMGPITTPEVWNPPPPYWIRMKKYSYIYIFFIMKTYIITRFSIYDFKHKAFKITECKNRDRYKSKLFSSKRLNI